MVAIVKFMAYLTSLPRLTVTAVLAIGLAACGRSAHQEAPRHADALVVCPGAEAVTWKTSARRDQLSYEVEVVYPAESVISCISNELAQNGWQPLKEDFWNPGLPSSEVGGWSQFIDATVNPEQTVYQWAAQWQNQAGDVAWYSLQYTYPPKDRYTLHVYAGFIPASEAKNEPKMPQARQLARLYELYSWPESRSIWNFCLLPSPSGLNIPIETIFDKECRITGIDELERKLSVLPIGTRIIWLPGLTADQTPNKESNKLALPPSSTVEKIKRYANQHGIQVEVPSSG